jgi:flagellar basal body-associated protein FliL
VRQNDSHKPRAGSRDELIVIVIVVVIVVIIIATATLGSLSR